jgi:hypothetical protein
MGLVLLSQSAMQAQDAPGPEIVTDRPTVTPAPVVVPPNYVQAENGFALREEYSGSSLNTPQTLIRLGVLPRIELRLTVPNYYLIRNNGATTSGVDDMSVGFKAQLGPLPGRIQLAIIPGFTVPTGSKDLTTHAVDPFIQTVASKRIKENWTLATAQAIFIQTEEEEVQVQGISSSCKAVIYQPTCVLFRKLGHHADAFIEYAGNFTKQKLSNQIIDLGAVHRFRRNQQLDIRVGCGFTKASPAAFVEFGYSILLGKLIR